MRTTRTDLPIDVGRVGPVSYLCDEGKHRRCTGLVPVGSVRWDDLTAVLCGCMIRPPCGCRDRARASLAAAPRSA